MGIDAKKAKEAAKAEKAAARAAKKAEKEAKKKDAKPRKKTPWKAKQEMRVERALKALTKLASVLTAAKAPIVDATLAANALSAVSTLSSQITMLDVDWKPARGHNPATGKRLGIGAQVQVKTDLERDEVKTFKHISADLFTNSTIVEDDGHYWLVKCQDGATRSLKKKYTQKYAPVAV